MLKNRFRKLSLATGLLVNSACTTLVNTHQTRVHSEPSLQVQDLQTNLQRDLLGAIKSTTVYENIPKLITHIDSDKTLLALYNQAVSTYAKAYDVQVTPEILSEITEIKKFIVEREVAEDYPEAASLIYFDADYNPYLPAEYTHENGFIFSRQADRLLNYKQLKAAYQKMASSYMQELHSLFRKAHKRQEQAQLKTLPHGEKFLEHLGISQFVDLEKYHALAEGKHVYRVSKKHPKLGNINYKIRFDDKYIIITIRNQEGIDLLHSSDTTLFNLRNLSAFQIAPVHVLTPFFTISLRQALDKMGDSPQVQKLTERLTLIEQEFTDSSMRTDKSKYEEFCRLYLEVFKDTFSFVLASADPELFTMFVRKMMLVINLEHAQEIIQGLPLNMSQLLQLNKNKPSIYTKQAVQKRTIELTSVMVAKVEQAAQQVSLSPDCKQFVKQLAEYGLIKSSPEKYVQLAQVLNPAILDEISDFIRRNVVDFAAGERFNLFIFLKDAASLESSQISLFLNNYSQNYDQHWSQDTGYSQINQLIKSSTDELYLENLKLLTDIESKSKFKKALYYFQMLDMALLKRHFDTIIQYFPEKLTAQQVQVVNQLKPYQLDLFDEALVSYLADSDYFQALLDISTKIHSYTQLRYLLFETIGKVGYGVTSAKPYLEHGKALSQIQEVLKLTLEYQDLWPTIDKYRDANSDMQFAGLVSYGQGQRIEGYSGKLTMLLDHKVSEQTIIQLIPELFAMKSGTAKEVLDKLFAKYHQQNKLVELYKVTAKMQGNIRTQDNKIRIFFNKAFHVPVSVSDILQLDNTLERLRYIPEQDVIIDALVVFWRESHDISKIDAVVSKLLDPILRPSLQSEQLSSTYPNIKDHKTAIVRCLTGLWGIDGLIQTDSVDLIIKLHQTLQHMNDAKYNVKVDPASQRLLYSLDPKSFLDKKVTRRTISEHLSYILNVLLDKQADFSQQDLKAWALSNLQNQSPEIQEKAAKLLIGIATDVQDYDLETLRHIAQVAVDKNITKYMVSDLVEEFHLEYLARAQAPKLPLSVYFSILINLQKSDSLQTGSQFQTSVDYYNKLKDNLVYKKQVYQVRGTSADKMAYTFNLQKPPFETTHTQEFSAAQGSSYEQRTINPETFEELESIRDMRGDLTIDIHMHGEDNKLQESATQQYQVSKLGKAILDRLKAQPAGTPAWKTNLNFISCKSSFNIEEIYKSTPELSSLPNEVLMLSSASENSYTNKLVTDAWHTAAQKAKRLGKPLTFETLYREIEAKNIVLTTQGGSVPANNNMTLYLNGKPLF